MHCTMVFWGHLTRQVLTIKVKAECRQMIRTTKWELLAHEADRFSKRCTSLLKYTLFHESVDESVDDFD